MQLRIPFLRRRAFTILELLIVLVVIGILTTLAIIQFGRVQEMAYVATMKSDLRNFATARAIYIAEMNEQASAESSETSLLASASFSSSLEAAPAAGETPPFEAVTAHDNSQNVFKVAYQSAATIDWFYTVGHQKTSTRCTISDLPEVNIRITCSPQAGSEDFTFAVRDGTTEREKIFEASLPNPGSVYSIIWEYGDGTSESGSPDSFMNRTHVYGADGTYSALMTILYGNGTTRSVGRTVIVGSGSGGGSTSGGTAPSASFTGGESGGVVGSAVTFTSTSTDPDGDSMIYGWNFGDGATGSGASVSHTYTSAGTYAVKLTVTDSQGKTANVSRDVTIGTFASRGVLYSGGCGTDTGKTKICYIPQGGSPSDTKILVSNSFNNQEPEWSPDGTKIAYSSGAYIIILHADGSPPTQFLQPLGSAAHRFPSWSPDGSKLVFTIWKNDGRTHQIWTANADGTNMVQLTPDDGVRRTEPDWSPDGSKILFVGNDPNLNSGSSYLYTMNPDGTNIQNLGVRGDAAQWSPDGTRIVLDNNYYFSATTGRVEIVNADGSGLVNLGKPPMGGEGSLPYPTWTPDGRIVFSHEQADNITNLYSVNADGTNYVQMTNVSTHAWHADVR